MLFFCNMVDDLKQGGEELHHTPEPEAKKGPFAKREVMPGTLKGAALDDFLRDAAMTYHHQTCTAKMGRDPLSVVDGQLRVYGVSHLRVADGSILPRVTTGNTMAPCVIIGERAGELLAAEHRL